MVKEPKRRRIRFGVISSHQGSFADTLRFWQHVEALGFDTVFLSDHFMGVGAAAPAADRHLEAWSLLSALAARTTRIRLGVLVTGNTYRSPALVAKMAATVDHVSGGRLILGIGAGWLAREHKAYGIPFYTPGGRARRLAEAVEVIERLLTTERSNYAGRFYTLRNAPCEPKAIQKPHPPILIGGMGPKVVQPLAARHAQIWHFMAPSGDPGEVRRTCENFDRLCAAVGRDPAAVEKATSLDPRAVAAPPNEVCARVRNLVDAGIGHVMLFAPPPGDEATLTRFAKEVMRVLRED
jgi:F420-dependent oxidoreductase-like protein